MFQVHPLAILALTTVLLCWGLGVLLFRTAMPNTENTPAYTTFRKMQVYETAVSEAREGGGISAKERVLLNRLRDSLGICESDAAAIEQELETRSSVTGKVQNA